MTRLTYTSAVALSVLLLQIRTQLLNCSDIECVPKKEDELKGKCQIDGSMITKIGFTNFSSALAPKPLTWTTGYAPEHLNPQNMTERIFYLGTPHSLDLNKRTDVTGCALFFDLLAISPEFGYLPSQICEVSPDEDSVSQVISLAHDAVANLTATGGALRCSDVAQRLMVDDPGLEYFGNITAKLITDPSVQPMARGDCTVTADKTYDVYDVAGFFAMEPAYQTPVMTIFAPTDKSSSVWNETEVHVTCLRPVSDDVKIPESAYNGGSALNVRRSLPALTVAAVGFAAITFYTL